MSGWFKIWRSLSFVSIVWLILLRHSVFSVHEAIQIGQYLISFQMGRKRGAKHKPLSGDFLVLNFNQKLLVLGKSGDP